MIKKKLSILLVILLSAFFLGLFSTSYAYTLDEFFDYAYQLYSDSTTNANVKNLTSLVLANESVIRNRITSNAPNSTSFLVGKENSGNYFTIYVATGNLNVSVNGSGINLQATNGRVVFDSVSSGRWSNGPTSGRYTYDKSFGLMETTGTIPSNYYFNTYEPEPDIYFIPNKDYIVTVRNINDVNCILRNWSINQWEIGKTFDFIDLDSYSMYFYDEFNNVEIGTLFANNSRSTLTYNGALYYSNGNLYVNSRLIEHNVLYRLYIQKWFEGDQFTEEHYFIFLPRNAVVSNGQIINVGSGDFNVQDSTNNIIDNANDTEAFENVMNELSQSGELIQRLNYKVYPNHSYDILFALTQNICDTLYASGDTYIDIDIHNFEHRFYTSDFNIPSNRLTIWIQMAIVFGYCYLLYKQASELIHAIQEGDLYVLELEDANEYFYM